MPSINLRNLTLTPAPTVPSRSYGEARKGTTHLLGVDFPLGLSADALALLRQAGIEGVGRKDKS